LGLSKKSTARFSLLKNNQNWRFLQILGRTIPRGLPETYRGLRRTPTQIQPADMAGVAGTAPPAPVAEQVLVAPAPDYIWVEGSWLWFWGSWVWNPGYWHWPISGAGKTTRLS